MLRPDPPQPSLTLHTELRESHCSANAQALQRMYNTSAEQSSALPVAAHFNISSFRVCSSMGNSTFNVHTPEAPLIQGYNDCGEHKANEELCACSYSCALPGAVLWEACFAQGLRQDGSGHETADKLTRQVNVQPHLQQRKATFGNCVHGATLSDVCQRTAARQRAHALSPL